jgi:nicotinamidase-related amidase
MNAGQSGQGLNAIGSGDALLIVDMINLFDFEDGQALGRNALRMAAILKRLRDRFDAAKLPVIYVNDNFMRWQADFKDLIEACVQSGGPSSNIVKALAPETGHYHVLKPKHSAFLDTPLAMLLDKLRVERVVVTGIAAEACVAATAQDAKMREFEVWVPSDCVAASTAERKRLALRWLRIASGLDVATSMDRSSTKAGDDQNPRHSD